MRHIFTTLLLIVTSTILLAQHYYINETFNDVEGGIFDPQLPTGWTGNMTVQMGVGLGGDEFGSNALVAEIDNATPTRNVFTQTIGPLLPGTTIEFSYRLLPELWGNPAIINLGDNAIKIKIAGATVMSITGASHTPTENWTVFSQTMTSHIGESVALELSVERDPQAPTSQTLAVYFEDMKVYAPVENDLAAVSLTGDMMPPVGSPANYTVTVRNNGDTTVSGYSVVLMLVSDLDDEELCEIECGELAGGATAVHELSFVPSTGGYHLIYGWVILAGDFNADNDTTSELQIYSPAAGTTVAQFGNHASTDFFLHPFYYAIPSALSQQIYLQSEIGHYGTIYALVLRFMNNSPVVATVNSEVQLYLGSTNVDLFTNSIIWIPLENFELVYTGMLDVMDRGLFDVIIPLDTPYEYTSGNLVMMGLVHNSSDSDNYGQWQTTLVSAGPLSAGRVQTATSWGAPIDISTGYPSNAFSSKQVPNMTIFFSQVNSTSDITVPSLRSVLKQNYPNPFNPSTTISFDIVSAGAVNVSVYNVRGQRVRVLVDKYMPVGEHNVAWDGLDEHGSAVGSGVYLYRMSAGGYSSVKKMVLMK